MNESGPSIEIGHFKVHPPGPWWFQAAVVLLVGGAFVWSLIWIARDAERRGRSGCVALLFLVAASWPLSILWWLWLRPPLHPRLPLPRKK